MDTFGDSSKWGGWGGYFDAKKQKLLGQFKQDRARLQEEHAAIVKDGLPKKPAADDDDAFNRNYDASTLFKGIAIFINGYTDPPAAELRRIMLQHGGTYHAYVRKGVTTHIIATNLPFAKQVQLKGERIARPAWIVDSLAQRVLLDWQQYELYPSAAEHQPSKRLKPDTARSLPTTSVVQQKAPERASESVEQIQPSPGKLFTRNQSSESDAASASDARNPDFVRKFYEKSRLHHLSTWKNEFQQLVGEIQAQAFPKFPGIERLSAAVAAANHQEPSLTTKPGSKLATRRIVMHLDMDCFFVSVGLLQKPQLRGKPVCVCHGRTGRGRREDEFILNPSDSSKSEIASCSYEARAKGVKNGMYFGNARRLCPDLQALPYDFDEYNRVSRILYHTVAEYTHAIEAISCDELYVDCTELLSKTHSTPEQFAALLRQEIAERTGGCPASAGIGNNKLLARLATKRAKPNGQYVLDRMRDEHDVLDYVAQLPIRELPGVGRQLEYKFNQLNIHRVGDLRRTPVGVLQATFGTFQGQKFHDMSNGLDDNKPVENVAVRKSISLEINYGIRLTTCEEFEQFFATFCAELAQRMLAAKVQGKHVTLKLLVRQEGEPLAPDKYMGHGLCDLLTKSEQLRRPTATKNELYSVGMALFKALLQSPSFAISDLRGVGLHVGKLFYQNTPAVANNQRKSGADDAGGGIQKYFKATTTKSAMERIPLGTAGNEDEVESPPMNDADEFSPSFEAAGDDDDDFFNGDKINDADDDADADGAEAMSTTFVTAVQPSAAAASADSAVPSTMKTTTDDSRGKNDCLNGADLFKFNDALARPDANGNKNLRFEAMRRLFLANLENLQPIYGRERIEKIRSFLLQPSNEDSAAVGNNLPAPLPTPKFADEIQERAFGDYMNTMQEKISCTEIGVGVPPYSMNAVEQITRNTFSLRHRDKPTFLSVRDADSINNNRLDNAASKRNMKPRQRLMAVSWYYQATGPIMSEQEQHALGKYCSNSRLEHDAVQKRDNKMHCRRRLPQLGQRVSSTQHQQQIQNMFVRAAAPPPSSSRRKVDNQQPTITQAFSRSPVKKPVRISDKEKNRNIMNESVLFVEEKSDDDAAEKNDVDSPPTLLLVDELLAAPHPSQLVRTRMRRFLSPKNLAVQQQQQELFDAVIPQTPATNIDGSTREHHQMPSNSSPVKKSTTILTAEPPIRASVASINTAAAAVEFKIPAVPVPVPRFPSSSSSSSSKRQSSSTAAAAFSATRRGGLGQPRGSGVSNAATGIRQLSRRTASTSTAATSGGGTVRKADIRKMSADILKFVGRTPTGERIRKLPKLVSLDDTICVDDGDDDVHVDKDVIAD